MLRPVLITAPGTALVTLTEAKAHCRVDFTDDDTLIGALVQAATDYLDGYSGILGRCLIDQTWKIDRAGFSNCIRLPFPDVSLVVVTYFDTGDSEQTVSSADYDLLEDSISSYVRFKDAFAAPPVYDRQDAVGVTLTVGYGASTTDVPQAVRQAALLLVGHWYENREAVMVGTSVIEFPLAVDALIAPFRRVNI